MPRTVLSNSQWRALLTRLFKKKGPAKLTPQSVSSIMKHDAPVTKEMSIMRDVGGVAPGAEAPKMTLPFEEARKEFARKPGKFRLESGAPQKSLREAGPGEAVQEGAFGEFGLKFEQQQFGKNPIPKELIDKLDDVIPPVGKGAAAKEVGASAADDVYKEILKGKRGVVGKEWEKMWKSSGPRSEAKRFETSKQYFDWFHEQWNTLGPAALRDKFAREVRIFGIIDELKAVGPEAAETEAFKLLRGKVPRQVRQRIKGGSER